MILWKLLIPVVLMASAPDVERIEVKNRKGLQLVTDGKGHYLALDPKEQTFFYGDGKVFFKNETTGFSGDNYVAWVDPRFGKYEEWARRVVHTKTTYRVKDGKHVVNCGERQTPVKPVPANQAARILKKAQFKRSPFVWDPYSLTRNNRGIYYYVDKGRFKDNQKRSRVFIGPKGAMKEQKLSNIVEDSEGNVYSTPDGDLRLVVSREEAAWIENDKSTQLVVVPIWNNLPLIYNELGVYLGQRMGTPCDDM